MEVLNIARYNNQYILLNQLY